MGKYERGDIELMEMSVVNVLMGKKPLINNSHKWYRHMVGFVEYIKSNFSGFKKVEYIGNKYEEPGDIKIYKADGDIEFLELKASETALGRGTLANISQDAVTKYQLIHNHSDKILSWSEQRKKNNFREKVESMLNEYEYTEEEYSFTDDKGKVHTYTKPFSLEDKGEIIKGLVEEGKEKPIDIKKRIMILAKQDKKSYVNYIRKFKADPDNLRKFIVCMIVGIHKGKEILKFFSQTDLDKIKKNYGELTILYANIKNERIVITKDKIQILELLDKSQNFEFSFPDERKEGISTYIISVNKAAKQQRRLLILVYLWKNVFQGIETPCINVFLGPDY